VSADEQKRDEISRICALIRARAVIRVYRDGGYSWEEIAKKAPKSANPLGLTPRQLSRIYEGEDAYRFDTLVRTVTAVSKSGA